MEINLNTGDINVISTEMWNIILRLLFHILAGNCNHGSHLSVATYKRFHVQTSPVDLLSMLREIIAVPHPKHRQSLEITSSH